MSREIVLIRHGRTPGNEAHRYNGVTDEPLSEAGRAALSGRRFDFDPPAVVYVTRLRRTRELCSIYGEDRMMFGSDFPMWNPASELQIFHSLGFSYAAYEKMCWRNAERWLATDIA